MTVICDGLDEMVCKSCTECLNCTFTDSFDCIYNKDQKEFKIGFKVDEIIYFKSQYLILDIAHLPNNLMNNVDISNVINRAII